MKYLYYILGCCILITISSCSSTRYSQSYPDGYSQNYDQQQTITYQQFYNDLSPYGDWINYDNYGYVWVPYQANFRPYYSNGHWVYTNYGWTWVSNYNWGWAPFHYGRWIDDMRFGWMWIPGYEWAPAWVTWRGGGDYYGWAPLGPGMDVHINAGSIPYTNWTFVPRHFINSPRINNYYVNQSRNVIIINNTRIINDQNSGPRRANYNSGPPVREVEQTTGTRIRRYNLVTSNKPEPTQVSNSSVRVFRPAVKPQPASSNARPQKVKSLDEIRGTNSAPVREFPKDQRPQILKNEPPVRNNTPGVTPERNNPEPARVFPKRNENSPAVTPEPQGRNNAPANGHPEEDKPANNRPVRVFPNTPTPPPANQKPDERQIRKAAPNEKPQVNQPENNNRPVRTFSRPSSVVKQNEHQQNKNNLRPEMAPEKTFKRNQQQSKVSSHQMLENNTPVRQPVRSVSPKTETVRRAQSQEQQKK